MYYLIKKNQKKLMAVFAVLLMISFVATIGVGRYGGGGGGSRGDAVVAHTGKTPILSSEAEQSREEWAWLSRQGGGRLPFPMLVLYRELIGDVAANPRDFAQQMGAFQLSHSITDTIDKHPETFLLLQREAADNGLEVTADTANSFLRNQMGRPVGSDEQERFQTKAVRDLLTVAAQLRHLMEATKVSQPVWQHEAARDQSVRLDLIDFRAADFQKSVPAPTTQQLQGQFDRFKDVPPNTRETGNPLGFGYQIPARVKLQYLTVPHAQVLDAVLHHVHPSATADLGGAAAASGDAAYDWEVQAALYYDQHKDEFKNDLSASQPAASASTQPSTKPAVPLGPALPFKPFPEVKQQIIDKLAAGEVAKLSQQIVDELSARLKGDFDTIHQADPAAVTPTTTQPATAPTVEAGATTRPTKDLMMLAHLEQIRAEIQQKHQVAIELHDIVNDWQTQGDLVKLPGIGAATAGDGAPFAEYATVFARPGMSFGLPPLAVWQPSAPLMDAQQNSYVFRLTAAEPPHPPAGMAAVAKQVEHDWRLSKGYDLAMDAAQKALASAKVSGLSQAARTAGQPEIFTPLFPPQQAQDVPGYTDVPPAASRELLTAATDLIAQATPTDRHPDTLVALPAAQRAVVMELSAVQLPDPEWLAQLRVTGNQQLTDIERLAADWFNYDQIVARTDYKVAEKS